MSSASIRAKLLNLSRYNQLDFQNIITRYFHECLLDKLSRSKWSDSFLLKGGNFIYSQYGFMSRPTTDLDFLGKNITNDAKELLEIFKSILKVETDDYVIFDENTLRTQIINEENEYHGVRITVVVSFDTIKQTIQVDVGFGDVVFPRPVKIDYPRLVNSNHQIRLSAYTIETVIAEKLQAILVLGELNSRMKDFYDIYTFLNHSKVNPKVLKEAITQTFKNRNTPLNLESTVFTPDFWQDQNRLKMWKAFLRKIKADELSFELVVREIHELTHSMFK